MSAALVIAVCGATADKKEYVKSVNEATVALTKALGSVGAEAGFVVLTGPGGSRAVELVTSSGYGDDELAAWRAVDLDSNVPFARAVFGPESSTEGA